MVSTHRKSIRGQGLVEYGLLLVLVGLLGVFSMSTSGRMTNASIQTVSDSIEVVAQ